MNLFIILVIVLSLFAVTLISLLGFISFHKKKLIYLSSRDEENKMLIFNIDGLNKKIEKLEWSNKSLTQKNEYLTSMYMADKATIKQSLTYGDTHHFSVIYEVDILEMTKNKCKVSATDFTTDDKKMSDPKHYNSILNYFKNKWVNVNDLDFILDRKPMRREMRFNSILDKEETK